MDRHWASPQAHFDISGLRSEEKEICYVTMVFHKNPSEIGSSFVFSSSFLPSLVSHCMLRQSKKSQFFRNISSSTTTHQSYAQQHLTLLILLMFIFY